MPVHCCSMTHEFSALTDKLETLCVTVQEIDPHMRQVLRHDDDRKQSMSVRTAKSLRKKLLKIMSKLSNFENKLQKAIQDWEAERCQTLPEYKERLIPSSQDEEHRMPTIQKRSGGGRARFNDV